MGPYRQAMLRARDPTDALARWAVGRLADALPPSLLLPGLFVLAALEFCQQRLTERRHITGGELAVADRAGVNTADDLSGPLHEPVQLRAGADVKTAEAVEELGEGQLLGLVAAGEHLRCEEEDDRTDEEVAEGGDDGRYEGHHHEVLAPQDQLSDAQGPVEG